MPNETITGLNGGVQLTTPASNDVIPVTDRSDITEAATGTTKPMELSNLVAEKVRESAGPTVLTLGAVADGEFLKRDGATIVSDTVASGPATQIEESGGPTTLDIATIVDGEFLKRVGTDIVSDSVPGGAEAGANSDITSMDGLTGALEFPTRVTVAEVAAPSTPPSGFVHIYAKSDGHLYIKDDTGTETDLTAAGGGSIAPLVIESANLVAQRNGVNAQNFYIYRTFTDASNYERLNIGWDGSNNFQIQAEAAGSGSQRHLDLRSGATRRLSYNGSQFFPDANNVTELGASANRFSNVRTVNVTVQAAVLFEGGSQITDAGASFGGVVKFGSLLTGDGTWSGGNNVANLGSTNKNNFDPSSIAHNQYWSSSADIDVTGMTRFQVQGQKHRIVNNGSFNITLKHQDTNSTAGNRFLCSTGVDIALGPNEGADVDYDGNVSRWRVFKL